MKKYVFTEAQVKRIIDQLITEKQTLNEDVTFNDEEKIAINSGSEQFLNSKGFKGKDLTEKIMKYQKSIGCEETGHMIDCVDTMYNKHKKDFDLWKTYIRKNKPLIDKIADWLGAGFGVKQDPKSIY